MICHVYHKCQSWTYLWFAGTFTSNIISSTSHAHSGAKNIHLRWVKDENSLLFKLCLHRQTAPSCFRKLYNYLKIKRMHSWHVFRRNNELGAESHRQAGGVTTRWETDRHSVAFDLVTRLLDNQHICKCAICSPAGYLWTLIAGHDFKNLRQSAPFESSRGADFWYIITPMQTSRGGGGGILEVACSQVWQKTNAKAPHVARTKRHPDKLKMADRSDIMK